MTGRAVAEKAVLTLTEALIPKAMFDRLPEYSCSLPTGTTVGKCWKRNLTFGTAEHSDEGPWMLGCYERELPPDERGCTRILIRWRKVTVVDS